MQDRRGEGAVLTSLGHIAQVRQEWEHAEGWYRQGLAAARQTQDMVNIASIAQALGELLIEHRSGREEGCQLLREAVRIYEQMGLDEQAEWSREFARALGCEV